MTLLYKYRSRSQLQYTLDVLLKNRLFAACFDQLNDPMEGMWHYGGNDTLWPDDIRWIQGQVERYRIVSLSENPVSTLMWSHYGDSHRGVVIGVEVSPEDGSHLLPVRYEANYTIARDATDAGIEVLSKKASPWAYEREYRVLTTGTFVPVIPRAVLFGIRADDELFEIVSMIALQFCPTAEIARLKESDLDTYLPPPQSEQPCW